MGRQDEMAQLEAILERSIEERGQVAGVVADAGTGKSRLCFEFAERCRSRDVAVREAHCVSHGTMIPLLPVLELLRGYFGIEESDGAREARQKIAGTVLLLDSELEPALPLLFELLGVPDPERPASKADPATRQRQIQGVIRRVVQSESARQPTLLLIEDLHWADSESAAFIAQLADAVQAERGLVLTNFRPEFHADGMERAGYRQIPLLPLGPDATRELLADLLGSDPSVGALGALVHEHTAAIPTSSRKWSATSPKRERFRATAARTA